MDPLGRGAAAANDGQRGLIEQIHPTFHIKQQRRVGDIQQCLRIAAIRKGDDMVVVVLQPDQCRGEGIFSDSLFDCGGGIRLDEWFE